MGRLVRAGTETFQLNLSILDALYADIDTCITRSLWVDVHSMLFLRPLFITVRSVYPYRILLASDT